MNTNRFKFATVYGVEGFEFAIVARTMKDLEIAWHKAVGEIIPFDPAKVSKIVIKKSAK